MGELETKKEFVAPSLEYPQSAEDCRPKYKAMVRAKQNNLLTRLKKMQERLRLQIANITTTDKLSDNQIDELDKLEEQMSEIENNILRTEYELKSDVELPLTEEEKS